MVVVVKLLAADEDAPRHDVGGDVLRLVVPIPPPMTDAVDDSGREDRLPRHLDRPDGETDGAEQHHVDEQHDVVAAVRVRLVDVALQPVVRTPVTVLRDRLRIGRGGAVQLRPFEEQLLDSEHLRAVRVVLRLHARVVLAVYRHPFLGHGPAREPEPEPEEVGERGVQIECPVCLMAVQVDRDGHDRDVGHPEGCEDIAPPRQIEQSGKHGFPPCLDDASKSSPAVAALRRSIPAAPAAGRAAARDSLRKPGCGESIPHCASGHDIPDTREILGGRPGRGPRRVSLRSRRRCRGRPRGARRPSRRSPRARTVPRPAAPATSARSCPGA